MFYHGSVVSGPANVLSSIQPVNQPVQWIVANSSDVPRNVDGQDDVRTLLSQNHPADTGLLTEEQETRGSCRHRGRVEDDGWREGENTISGHSVLSGKRRLKFAQCIL